MWKREGTFFSSPEWQYFAHHKHFHQDSFSVSLPFSIFLFCLNSVSLELCNIIAQIYMSGLKLCHTVGGGVFHNSFMLPTACCSCSFPLISHPQRLHKMAHACTSNKQVIVCKTRFLSTTVFAILFSFLLIIAKKNLDANKVMAHGLSLWTQSLLVQMPFTLKWFILIPYL